MDISSVRFEGDEKPMGEGSKKEFLSPEARAAFRQEVARELGVHVPKDGYMGEITSKQCGSMVKKIIEMYEQTFHE